MHNKRSSTLLGSSSMHCTMEDLSRTCHHNAYAFTTVVHPTMAGAVCCYPTEDPIAYNYYLLKYHPTERESYTEAN